MSLSYRTSFFIDELIDQRNLAFSDEFSNRLFSFLNRLFRDSIYAVIVSYEIDFLLIHSRLFRSIEATLQWLSTPLLPIYTPSFIRCKSLEISSWLPASSNVWRVI
jgi:hypothetical protein